MKLRISEVIREKRKAKGLTQEELAEKVGVSAGYVGQVERGELTPSLSVIAMLVDILALTPTRSFLSRMRMRR